MKRIFLALILLFLNCHNAYADEYVRSLATSMAKNLLEKSIEITKEDKKQTPQINHPTPPTKLTLEGAYLSERVIVHTVEEHIKDFSSINVIEEGLYTEGRFRGHPYCIEGEGLLPVAKLSRELEIIEKEAQDYRTTARRLSELYARASEINAIDINPRDSFACQIIDGKFRGNKANGVMEIINMNYATQRARNP